MVVSFLLFAFCFFLFAFCFLLFVMWWGGGQRVIVRASEDMVLRKSVQGERNEACLDFRAATRLI